MSHKPTSTGRSASGARIAVHAAVHAARLTWLWLLAAVLLALVNPARAGVVCWSEQGGSIWLANVDGTAIRQILSSTGGARGVCVDTARGKVYWAAYSGNYIGRANLDGSGVEVVTAASTPAGVAIDSAGGRLFFAEYGNGGQVVQCNLDGSNRIVLTTATANPTGIVYGDGYVYYTDWNDQYNGVFRVPAGGGTRSTVASGINGSYGVTYESSGYVWFGDWTTDTIIRRAANGSGSNLIVASGAMAADSWGISVDPDGSGVYWARQLGGGIFRASTGGGSVGPALPTTSTPWGVCVFAGRGPSIFAQPQSQSVFVGQPVTLSVGVSGTPYFRYQWVRNGSDIPGATSPTYSIGAASLASAGQYWVNVWSPLGAVGSQPATLNVSNPCEIPTFTEQPQPVATCEGLAASWSAAAAGTLPISYRWQRNGVDVPGANSSTLSLQSVSQAAAGAYTCIATGPCGSTTSAPAELIVRTAPAVLGQPQSQTGTIGGAVVLGMQIVPDPTAAFQWSRNGAELSDGPGISGAATSSLSLTNLSLESEGTYTCAVTVACGSVVSQRAVLSLADCPRSWSNLGGGPFGNRANMAQAYSPVNGGTLCFGGVIDGDLMTGDTWLLTGNSWGQISDSGPPARYIAAMCELPSGHVLLFGGQSAYQTLATTLGDTWEWDGQTWSRVATAGPAPRAGHSMVYDSARGRVVLFGGLGATGNLYRDTWEWGNGQWTRVADAGPTPRFGQAMAFDPVSREMIMFGGFGAAGLRPEPGRGTVSPGGSPRRPELFLAITRT
ncbi:MAG: immunoglobulin domain-containing protein [Phycisphaerales bacterium]